MSDGHGDGRKLSSEERRTEMAQRLRWWADDFRCDCNDAEKFISWLREAAEMLEEPS